MAEQATKRTTGIVKWFDSRGGFGFITILKGEENEGKDIFVHYSTLSTTSSQYKYLVLGEYVEFQLTKAENEKYEFFAENVSGIRGGNLMCESRRLSTLESRPQQGDVQDSFSRVDVKQVRERNTQKYSTETNMRESQPRLQRSSKVAPPRRETTLGPKKTNSSSSRASISSSTVAP
jgi:cold shock CspA family protein